VSTPSYYFQGSYADGTALDPSIFRFNQSTGELTVKAYSSKAGSYRIKMDVVDSCGSTASLYIKVLLNSPPKAGTFPTLYAVEQENFLYQIPDDFFYDDDGQNLTITCQTSLSGHWIDFWDGAKKTLEGTPYFDQTYSLVIRATDPYDSYFDATLTIIVVDTDGPQLTQ